MKVIKEAEGDLGTESINTIDAWKQQYENAVGNEKIEVVREILTPIIGDNDKLNKILNFGLEFVDNWINSMKWVEIGNKDNEFIALLNNDTVIEDFNTGSSLYEITDTMLNSKEDFIKLYNVYVNGDLDAALLRESSSEGDTYRALIGSQDISKISEGDIKQIVNIFLQLYDKGIKDPVLRDVFFSKENLGSGDREYTMNLNPLTQVLKNVQEFNIKSDAAKKRDTSEINIETGKKNIDSYISNDELRDYMIQAIQNNL